ncbi:Polysaccharide deacetylase [Richelia intracellularis HM01]|nr:Polysaccharide deacetylase [Richelia intracellularis HM01]
MLSTWQNQAFKKGLAYNRPEGFQGVIINQAQVTRGRKLIALTFDDGPWDNHTREILDILKKIK